MHFLNCFLSTEDLHDDLELNIVAKTRCKRNERLFYG